MSDRVKLVFSQGGWDEELYMLENTPSSELGALLQAIADEADQVDYQAKMETLEEGFYDE